MSIVVTARRLVEPIIGDSNFMKMKKASKSSGSPARQRPARSSLSSSKARASRSTAMASTFS
jgi:hypothetical protein